VLAGRSRGNQKLDGRLCRARVLPAPAGELPGLVRVGAEPGLSKTRSDLPVTFIRGDPEMKTEVARLDPWVKRPCLVKLLRDPRLAWL